MVVCPEISNDNDMKLDDMSENVGNVNIVETSITWPSLQVANNRAALHRPYINRVLAYVSTELISVRLTFFAAV